VLALAGQTGADLVLANDPDADRLAAAVPDPSGGYRMLSGNEIGALLAADAIEHTDTGGRRKVVVTTVVSSSLLRRIAGAKRVAYRETLTGFKWIVKAALEAEAAGDVFVFGYEEALGYTVGPLVRDKDGIGSAVHLARLARFLESQGRTLLDRMDELLITHELVHPVQWSVVLPGLEGRQRIRGAMEALRAQPLERLGRSPVERVLDADAGEETVNGKTRPVDLPRADLVTFESVDGARLTARPSGTEPKIKFYLELVAQAHTPAEVASTRVRLEEEGQALRRALMERLSLS